MWFNFAKLPPLFNQLTKCCPGHDFWHCAHVTKCCACHEIPKCTCTECCAGHEKNTPSHWHASKVLHLHATQNANATSTHVTKRNKSMLFARKLTSSTSSGSHFVSAAQWWGLATSLRTCCKRLRTVEVARATLDPSLRIREKGHGLNHQPTALDFHLILESHPFINGCFSWMMVPKSLQIGKWLEITISIHLKNTVVVFFSGKTQVTHSPFDMFIDFHCSNREDSRSTFFEADDTRQTRTWR